MVKVDGFQIAGLDILLELLLQVKSDGWRDPLVDENMEGRQGRPVSHSSLLHTLRVAKLSMKAILEIQKHLGRIIRSLEKRVVPMAFQEGITHLPDEILAQIFEMGHKATNGSGFSKRVSQVSRRFRQVAFQTPLLWTRISGTYSDSLIETHISRSGQLDLEVVIPSLNTARNIPSAFLRGQIPYTSRWSHLHIFSDSAMSWLEALSITRLPRLSMIEYHHDAPLYGLTLPRLSHIRGYGYIQPAIPFLLQLTTFEFFSSPSNHIQIPQLSLALYSMQSLQALSITLDGNLDTIGQLDHLLQHRSVHIDTLSVTVKNMTSSYAVKSIYDCLLFLSPAELFLTLDNLETAFGWDFFYGTDINVLFPYGSSIYVSVSNVRVRENVLDFDLLEELAGGCDVARTICIEAPGSSIVTFGFDPGSLQQYPSHLRLKNCDRLTEESLAALLDQFFFTAVGIGLHSLAIISCRQISERFLLNLEDEVGEKLTWQL